MTEVRTNESAESDRAPVDATEEIASLRQELSLMRMSITEQQRQISDQQQQIAGLGGTGTETNDAAPDPRLAEPRKGSRRDLLKLAGGAAAGLAGAAVLGSQPAAAANNPVLVDQSNASTLTTTIDATGGTGDVTGLHGIGMGAGPGLSGAAGASGPGVSGLGAGGASGPGVFGQAGGKDGDGVSGAGIGTGSGVSATGGGTSGNGAKLTGGGTGAPLNLVPNGSAGAPTLGAHAAGDVWVDSNGIFWVCIASNTPGTWIRLAGVPSTSIGGAINYLTSPVRVIDTRGGSQVGPVTGPLAANSITTFGAFTGAPGNLPAGITGLIGNLTAIGMAGNGFITIFPAGQTTPNVSTVNFGSSVFAWSNAFTVAVGTAGNAGKVSVFVSNNVAVDIAIDITGYVM
jgi:hypothetical protein